jgi:hypothetical protein
VVTFSVVSHPSATEGFPPPHSEGTLPIRIPAFAAGGWSGRRPPRPSGCRRAGDKSIHASWRPRTRRSRGRRRRTRADEGLDRMWGTRVDWRPSGVASLNGRPMQTDRSGASRVFSGRPRGSRLLFCFPPSGARTPIDRAPRCTPTPSSPGSQSRRPRRACEAWRCRVPSRRPPSPHGEVWKRVRRIRAAIRGSAVGISETPWEVLRRRARTAPPGAGAGSKAPCLPHATGEAGRLSVAVQDLFDNSGSGERNSAVRVETRRGKERPAWRTRLPVPCVFSAPRGAPAAARMMK